MTNLQLTSARTSALAAESTSPYGPNKADRLILEDAARSAQPSGSDRVNILGVGAMPLDLDKAVGMLEQWRIERRREYVCLRLRARPRSSATRPDRSRRAQSLRLGGRGRDAIGLVVAPHRFFSGAPRVRLLICSTRSVPTVCHANTAITSTARARASWSYWSIVSSGAILG